MTDGRKEYVSLAVLVFINLLNYADRYTVAGVLPDVQRYYEINDSMAGLIQTVFLIFYMIATPACGYLGDRYNRKWTIMGGLIIWLIAVIGSSLVPAKYFLVFLLLRGIVGVGEASYSTVAPALISDMFTGIIRSRSYMVFYFAIPVGSGIGFIVASQISNWLGEWQWGVRATAVAGVAAMLLLFFVVEEPERGAADKFSLRQTKGSTESTATGSASPLNGNQKNGGSASPVTRGNSVAATKTKSTESPKNSAEPERTSHWGDIVALSKCRTYVTCVTAYTLLIFVTGTLSWWEPTTVKHLTAWQNKLNDTIDLPQGDSESIGLYFGVITTLAGIIGVTMGNMLSWWISEGMGPFACCKTPRAKPIVAGTGALMAAPLCIVLFIYGHTNITMVWVLLFLIITFLCLNWGLNVDMLMTVIVPSRRSTAFAYFSLIGHLFGDASGPYIVGLISDLLRDGSTDPYIQYQALVWASSISVILLFSSCAMYYLTAYVLVTDQKKYMAQMIIILGTPPSMSNEAVERRVESHE